MKYVQGSSKIFDVNTWNGSHGNKLLNLFAVAKFADLHGLRPIVPESYSSPFVDFTEYWITVDRKIQCQTIQDPDPFDLGRMLNFTARRFGKVIDFSRFAIANIKFNKQVVAKRFFEFPASSIELCGFFFDADYQIDQRIFNKYFIPKYDIEDTHLKETLSVSNDICIVHVRGTDFENHLRWAYPNSICLSRNYYSEAINLIRRVAGKPLKFWVVTDDMLHARRVLSGLECKFIDQGSAVLDWHLLRKCHYRIESNSSFCWTASSCNSNAISIFPKYGYGRLRDVQYPSQFKYENTSTLALEFP